MNKTSDKIIAYISQKGQAGGQELAGYLDITDRAIRKQLRSLFKSGKIEKVGKPPKVFYILPKKQSALKTDSARFSAKSGDARMDEISSEARRIIENNFLYITPRGERLDGAKGFIRWCDDRSLDIGKKAIEYAAIYKKYAEFKENGLISGKKKIEDTFKNGICLNDIFYADFYTWEIFGKTKLGQLLLYGKQSQDKKIIMEITEGIKLLVGFLIKKYGIKAVGFIPPTIKREVQFMKVLEKGLRVTVPVFKIEKAKTEIITPQKTLSKLQDRIENAEHSIFVTDIRKFGNVLLIDDAVGSGATMNQVACKIKKAGLAKKVFGFAITGSAKGFDVISEV